VLSYCIHHLTVLPDLDPGERTLGRSGDGFTGLRIKDTFVAGTEQLFALPFIVDCAREMRTFATIRNKATIGKV
jgi:hypothetical protein